MRPVLVLLLFFIFSTLEAQTVQWAKKGGGISSDLTKSIAVDPAGNSFVVGTFQNTVTFGSFSITGPTVATNSFIAKYDDLGNIQWLRQVSGTSNNALFAVSYSAVQNCIYVGGRFAGSITVGPFILISSGGNDCFFAKYDMAGNCLWAIKAGSINGEEVDGIDSDLAGNLVASGWVSSGAAFGSFVVPSHPLTQTFTTIISPQGVFLWLSISCYTAGSSVTTSYPVIKADRFLNVFVCGLYSSTCVFGSQTLTGQGLSVNPNLFLQKLDPAGNILWTVSIGGTQPVDVYGISTDVSGNVYITGSFRGTVNFGGTMLTSTGGPINNDCYLAKYDPSGVLQWANQYGSSNVDVGRSVEVFSNGNILFSGYYSTSTQIGSYSFSAPLVEAFVAICNPSGIPLWVQSYGGSSSDYLIGAVTNNINIYAAGYFNGPASNYGSFQLATNGNMDASIIKISWPIPLPVELVSFTAQPSNNNKFVQCKWISASEVNNDFYFLEKSRDGILFFPFGKVPALQNNSGYNYYQFTDDDPYQGISYYRLSQTDYNGQTKKLKTVGVRLDVFNDMSIVCYPVNENNDFLFSSVMPITVIQVIDATGRIVKSENYNVNTFQKIISLSNFNNGIYYVQLFSGSEKITRKILVM